MSRHRLWDMYEKADALDLEDGRLAYLRYHVLMQKISYKYHMPLDRVVGVFCTLSPNNDYLGNLRGLVTMLEAKMKGVPYSRCTTGTYHHCRDRAALILDGRTTLVDQSKGYKIKSFYRNILDPLDPEPVTVDGHIYWAWMGGDGTMSEARVTNTLYREIAESIRHMAHEEGSLANQVQATLWFTRKRLLGRVYTPQLGLFDDNAGAQKTAYEVDEIEPFAFA